MSGPKFDEDALEGVYGEALAEEKAGRFDAAAKAYRACLEIDPDDHVGARLRLAALGLGETPETAGDAYVATLFDQQAEMFEDILVRQLGYGVPALIGEALTRLGFHHFERALDLGCGTGLVGLALDGRADTMMGVDLSENMVEIAFDSGAYDHLYIGEALGFLGDFEEDEPFDLIAAADVLPYFGELSPLLEAVFARLAPGGVFVASTETFATDGAGGSDGPGAPGEPGRPEGGAQRHAGRAGGADFAVGRDHRFHHGEDYVRKAFEAAGLEVLQAEPIIVRMQEGRPAPGHLFVARRSL
ncbi:methyltransferase domain-containing protein [Jiella endophytica]|uniref:Methyltransferase domain-containing protein n=1 Tax=Jiella endophytica TaxID=2558362 RepID=A0A4Y8RBS0_9HYPH|nr:methyltransferase domain-containing protein [Jiella endophytica]TFF19178.1 methyltransferase domain-containing protein [Jiella endophytica]